MESPSVLDVIIARTSVRNFERDRKVPERILEKILLAGTRAPSAGNIQPRTIIVVRDESVRERLYEVCNQAFMKDAPVWVVMCADLHRHLKAAKLSGVRYDFTGVLPYTWSVLDTALSLENMIIAAEASGLGSVIIGSVIDHPEEVKEILKLPEHCFALCMLCIGYPKNRPRRKEKWNYDVMVSEDCYKDINSKDVSEYWKTTTYTEESYGMHYSVRHTYKEKVIRANNQKLRAFLREQKLVEEQ